MDQVIKYVRFLLKSGYLSEIICLVILLLRRQWACIIEQNRLTLSRVQPPVIEETRWGLVAPSKAHRKHFKENSHGLFGQHNTSHCSIVCYRALGVDGALLLCSGPSFGAVWPRRWWHPQAVGSQWWLSSPKKTAPEFTKAMTALVQAVEPCSLKMHNFSLLSFCFVTEGEGRMVPETGDNVSPASQLVFLVAISRNMTHHPAAICTAQSANVCPKPSLVPLCSSFWESGSCHHRAFLYSFLCSCLVFHALPFPFVCPPVPGQSGYCCLDSMCLISFF